MVAAGASPIGEASPPARGRRSNAEESASGLAYLQARAEVSQCGQYRYALWRSWQPSGRTLLFVGLNPSTADGHRDDPTLRRCVGFAKRLGFGTLAVGNLFAYRSADPGELRNVDDPVGPDNEHWLARLLTAADMVLVGWGSAPIAALRSREVLSAVEQVFCLGLTAGGAPRHPLYLRADSRLMKFRSRCITHSD